jgi:hypothetical protein
MSRIGGLAFLLFFYSWLWAQHQDPSWSVRRAIIDRSCQQNDSLCNVLHQHGVFEGHLRNFFMGTINGNGFPDYFAWGIGGGLGYYSPVIKNLQVGFSGFIIYNMASSDLQPRPPFPNRYEIALFDVTNPQNRNDMDRLEDLYLRYYLGASGKETKTYIQVGKFHLKSPLINLQDGRMRPNLQEGLWMEWNKWKKINLEGGLLWRTSPRGTIRWYGIGSSVGVYPGGRAINGARANYAGHVHTKWVWVGKAGYNPSHNTSIETWNYLAESLFNLAMFKIQLRKSTDYNNWFAYFQYLWQHSLFRDSLPIEQQYIGCDEQSHVFSARLGKMYKRTGEEWTLNYTRITSHGRFLFPREWGVESFYTFLPRERLEGMGDVHALMVQHRNFLDREHHLHLTTATGTYLLPPVHNTRLNKYAMPSFYQLNLRVGYKFSGFLHGLQADLLYLYKGNLVSDLEKIPEYFHNKVNMHHFSLMLDYYF